MSISSFTLVTMLDSRPAPMTISMPRTNDIPNRVIMFKDIYGAALRSTVTLVTQGGDVFENGAFSTILSNAFDTVTFHAGLPGRWHRTAGTNVVGSITNASTFTNSLSTSMAYAKFFVGDGSLLTNVTPTFSGLTNFNSITVSNAANIFTISTGSISSFNICNTGILSNVGAAFINGLTRTTILSNTGAICNSGILSNVGAAFIDGLTRTTILSNTGAICNSGILSNVGAAFIVGTTTLATTNISGQLTTTGGITGTTGTTNLGLTNTTILSNTGAICNSGILSNVGAAFIDGLTRTTILSNTGAICNSGILSNVGAAFIVGGLTATAGTTTLGTTNTTSISNSGNISTNTLNVGQISSVGSYADYAEVRLIQANEAVSFPEAIIYDSNTFSTGTFRYSTLTSLFALPNTSLLYFNNLVLGGAYVWPGQTISALDWTSLYQSGSPASNYIIVAQGATANTFNQSIFIDVTGGTPPYAVVSMTPNDIMTVGKLGFGSGANAGVVLTNSSLAGNTQTSPSNVIFTLADSSSPRFTRTVEYYWQIGPPAA